MFLDNSVLYLHELKLLKTYRGDTVELNLLITIHITHNS